MNKLSNSLLEDSNFLNALTELVKPFITEVNSAVSDNDLLRNTKLSSSIRTLAGSKLNKAQVNDLKLFAYHKIKVGQIAERLGFMDEDTEFTENVYQPKDMEQHVQYLAGSIKQEADSTLLEYVSDFDIKQVLGKDVDYFNVLIDFICQESETGHTKTILEHLFNRIILSKRYIQNAKVVMALPDLVNDRGVQFEKHFGDQEFVCCSFKFEDVEDNNTTFFYPSWNLKLELTRTTRQIIIEDSNGKSDYKILF